MYRAPQPIARSMVSLERPWQLFASLHVFRLRLILIWNSHGDTR